MTTVPIPSGRSGDEERALSTLDYWSPVRPLRLIGTGVALTAIDFVDDGAGIRSRNHAAAAGPVLREAARQLDAYFRGRLTGYGGGLDVKAALLALEAARGRNPTARPPITRDEPPRSAGPAGQVHHRAQSRFQEVAIVGPKRDVAELPASSGGLVVEMEVSALDGEDPGGRG